MDLNASGGRGGAGLVSGKFDPAAPRTWPVQIDKQIGASPLIVLWAPAIGAVFLMGPSLAAGLSLPDVLLHTSSGVILGGVLLFLAALVFTTRKRGRLTIDASGIDVWTGKIHAFYAWADITGLDVVKAGVQVALKGRTTEQNQYNLIAASFVGNAAKLRALLTEARAHFGEGSGQAGRSISPGDDLRSARLRACKLIAAIVIPIPVVLFGCIFVWQLSDYLKTVDLQKYGRRGEGAVVRIFTADCGKSGCSLDVQFRYAPEGAAQPLVGIERIASDRDSDDPDLVYAKTHGVVPIVYDARKPGVVALNFRERVYRNASRTFAMMMGVMSVIMGIVLIPMLILVGWYYARAVRTPPSSPAQPTLVVR